jgi:hypothetical protein
MGVPGGSRWAGGALAVGLIASAPGAAFEFADGRVQVHGFYEAQVRSLVRDYEMEDEWDLTQWWNVLNVEVDWDIAPDGVGPFDLISAFGRVEARYDCVWTHACNTFDSADAYGNRARFGGDPRRLMDGRRSGYTYQSITGDRRFHYGLSPEQRANHYDASGILPPSPNGGRRVMPLSDIPGFEGLFGVPGQDQVLGTADDPAPFYFSFLRNCRFGVRRIGGTESDNGSQVLPHTVDENRCDIKPLGTLLDKPNPFNPNDADPTRAVLPDGGAFAQPFRPAPLFTDDGVNPSDPSQVYSKAFARGVYYPNAHLQRLIGKDEFDNFDQNFTQDELEWNRGASQQQTKELKELFAEFEMFDSRLYVRAGKQQIVWGKTELFRTTDQFNPQDLGLGSLTSLEESRIALWAIKGIYSFYEVGPLEDVRLELGANIDEFEPTDLGRCGEPYSPLPACDLTYGLMAHGLTGLAIAGTDKPEDPWDSTQGFEVGARLEFRWDRFSFALIDFYGYDDGFWVDQNFVYSRNVDPQTGRPRHTMATGPCTTGAEPDCLQPGQAGTNNALQFHSANQQLFAMICATSIGFSTLDPAACAQSIFNSTTNALTGQPAADPTSEVTLASLLSNLVAGNFGSHTLVRAGLTFNVAVPTVRLNADPGDNPTGLPVNSNPVFSAQGGPHINDVLTDEQMALLGCGPFYQTNCEIDGVDLLNTEASALLQSLLGIEGTPVAGLGDLGPDGIPNTADDVTPMTTNPFVAQPGTFSFRTFVAGTDVGAVLPACTRGIDGQLLIVPGCRGPGPDYVAGTADDDPGYNVLADGTPTGLIPFFDPASPFFQGQTSSLDMRFVSEFAGLSWNAVMALVALSSPPETVTLEDGTVISTDQNGDGRPDSQFIAQDQFDPNQPFRSDGCSFAVPGACGNVAALGGVMGVTRNTVLAGGTSRFGRRDFIWHGGQEVVLRYEKRNVLGWSLDFAEDVTKTNWGVEFTWIEGLPTADADAFDGISKTNQYNLTIAVDRPTFVNFLNQNRTFFVTTQWFMRYTDNYVKSMPAAGPWSTLAILNVSTGYFQDRLLPAVTFVYDLRSNSAAVLPQVQYRFTENFSATFGLAAFSGRWEERTPALTPVSLGNRVGEGSYKAHVQRGLSLIQERDEVFLRVRYTF